MYENWNNPLDDIRGENYEARSTPIFVLAIFILLLSIGGLIMSASGVPWYYNNGEAEDYDECCLETYEDDFIDQFPTIKMVVAPMTAAFVLLICFSVPLIGLFFIPMKRWLRVPLTALFGLAILTNSIFMLRRFTFMLSNYLEELEQASLRDASVDFHLHVMPYFFLLVSLIGLVLGLNVVKSVRPKTQNKNSLERSSFGFLRICLLTCITILFLNPIIPLANDTDSGYGSNGEHDFIYQYTAYLYLDYDYGDDETEDSFGNHKIAENMVIVMVWICLSLLLIMSLYGIPKMKEIVNGITQLSALMIVFIIIASVFSILFYVNIDELGSDFYPHANWLIPLGCLIMLGSWISFLVSSHIPWWKQVSTKSNSNHIIPPQQKEYSSKNIITCPNCQIQIDTSLIR